MVTTFHDLRVPYLFPRAGPLREWVTRVLARASDATVVTNEEDSLALRNWGLRRHALIPIGSNIPAVLPPDYRRDEWRSRLGVEGGATLLSYFGFLNASKGAETLIQALAKIPEAKLLMVGGQVGTSDPTNVAYRTRVRDLIGELGLESRVIWTDFTPASEVSANLLASDICVLPYRDGASYRRGSFMAALAHGLPIVTTHPRPPISQDHAAGLDARVQGASQGQGDSLPALSDGENVMLVAPDDPVAIAEAISHLTALPELRLKLSRGAYALAENFTWDRIARRHLELYKLLVAVQTVDPVIGPRGT
jgi:glycosyltransferase involved in cell wall biosynthesis